MKMLHHSIQNPIKLYYLDEVFCRNPELWNIIAGRHVGLSARAALDKGVPAFDQSACIHDQHNKQHAKFQAALVIKVFTHSYYLLVIHFPMRAQDIFQVLREPHASTASGCM